MPLNKNTYKIIWSYTIYGNDFKKYYKPLLNNILLAKSLNISIVVSTTDLYEGIVKNYFKEFDNFLKFEIFSSTKFVGKEKLLRYLALKNKDFDYAFVKDTDSIVTDRELFIMNNWINLPTYNSLIIRDHHLHISPILAGMFGFNKINSNLIIDNCEKHIENLKISKNNIYNYDQVWLARFIYPLVISKSLVYTRTFYFKNENFAIIPLNILENKNYIGKQAYSYDVDNEKFNYLKFYNKSLLSIKYIYNLPFFIFKLIYNRVRPTIYLAFLNKLITKGKIW